MGISAHIARLRAAVGHEAAIIAGSPGPSDDELSDVAWFAPGQLTGLELSHFTRALLSATGHL